MIMRWCRHLRPLIIGVFKDQSIQEINSILETSSIDIDLVQLHGSESKQFANEVRKPVIRVIHVSSSSEQLYLKKSVEDACDTQNVCAILFDTTGGGAGKTFDWSLIRPYASQVISILSCHNYIAVIVDLNFEYP